MKTTRCLTIVGVTFKHIPTLMLQKKRVDAGLRLKQACSTGMCGLFFSYYSNKHLLHFEIIGDFQHFVFNLNIRIKVVSGEWANNTQVENLK